MNGEVTPGATRRRKRSAVACTKCHQRKVRCDVSQVGLPCSNCAHDHFICRAPLHREKPSSLPRLLPRASVTSLSNGGQTPGIAETQESIPDSTSVPSTRTDKSPPISGNKRDYSEIRSFFEQADVPVESSETRLVRYRVTDDFVHDEADCEKITLSESMLCFAGNEEGLEFIFDTCFPTRAVKSNHYIIPRPPPKAKFGHDSGLQEPLLTSFPEDLVTHELFQCYFQYVHPFLPIVDANDFLSTSNSPRRRSPLLKWSMLFAASSFISKTGLKNANYPSRKAMKRAMYRQAKRLYDAEVESDRVILIQSALLLSHWYADLEDRSGSWQWVAAAISVCQTIGMHRSPKGTPGARHLYPHYQSRLWRRIFWTCYLRDVWLSLGLGRPMRINLDDCDTPIPSLGDLVADIGGSLEGAGGRLLYDDCVALARYWLNLLKLTILLGGILASVYRPGSKPTVLDIEVQERNILNNSLEAQNYGRQGNLIVMLHWCHLKAYYNAVIIALYRPFLQQTPTNLPQWRSAAFYTSTLQKLKTAASSTSATLSELITLDLINYCSSIMLIAMMPAAQIHLHESKSPDPLSRSHASHQLDLHMTVLRELQKTYWAADMQYDLFAKARVATLALPSPESVPSQQEGTQGPGLLSKEALEYATGTGSPWAYLDMQFPNAFGMVGGGGAVHGNAGLDFFESVPAMQVIDGDGRLQERRDAGYETYV